MMGLFDGKRLRPTDPSFIEEILKARRMSIGQRMLEGARLFDLECDQKRCELRSHFPEWSEKQINDEIGRLLATQRQIDEAGLYKNVADLDE